MNHRVVITGMGVVAPNGIGLTSFEAALREGRSGLRFREELRELGFGCQVVGVPEVPEDLAAAYWGEDENRAMNSNMVYAALAGLDAWADAGLARPPSGGDEVDWDTGAIIGTGIGGMDTIADRLVDPVRQGRVRRLGSTLVEQIMASGVSARLSGFLGLGNWVSTNSSACTTGTEAIVTALRNIRAGHARRMLAGGSEGCSPYIWAGFDAMRVLMRKSNDAPERASRPMSASAGGFVPAAGAGVLVLEDFDSARERGVHIYAEVLGGALNCGGQRMGGSMTAPNPVGTRRCIRAAIDDAGITPDDIDTINGHLTSTGADPLEIHAWADALERPVERFPTITATKSMIGHALGAAGAIESVASILMLSRGFIHPSINCEDLHPEISAFEAAILHAPDQTRAPRVLIKAGFGFGDVNGCVVFRRWEENGAPQQTP
jgi:3-oxoacyl-(acyl-carrier-protein) synthase